MILHVLHGVIVVLIVLCFPFGMSAALIAGDKRSR
jgi:hypothetical protein